MSSSAMSSPLMRRVLMTCSSISCTNLVRHAKEVKEARDRAKATLRARGEDIAEEDIGQCPLACSWRPSAPFHLCSDADFISRLAVCRCRAPGRCSGPRTRRDRRRTSSRSSPTSHDPSTGTGSRSRRTPTLAIRSKCRHRICQAHRCEFGYPTRLP